MPLYTGAGVLGGPEASPHLSNASGITLLGTSFKTANIEFRERFAQMVGRVQDLVSSAEFREFSTLQTCNRIEIYAAHNSNGVGVEEALQQLGYGSSRGFYIKQNLDAIKHLFAVAAGLDSVAVGEEQILGQVRAAGMKARSTGSAKSILIPLFDAAYSSGVRARKAYPTSITERSLSEVALGFALERLGRRPSSVLVVGTGGTAKLAALRLKGSRVYFLTGRRSVGRFVPNSVRVSQRSLRNAAAECELVVAATRRAGYVLSRDDIPDDKKRVVLDLGFPRNVDPALKSSRFIELLDLDDIASLAERVDDGADLAAAERVVETEATRFHAWLTATRLNPTLATVYKWAEGIRADEASSALRRLPELSNRERKVVEAMSRRLVSRLMAPHAEFVKRRGQPADQSERLRLLEEIFGAEKRS